LKEGRQELCEQLKRHLQNYEYAREKDRDQSKRNENYQEWYQEVMKAADLANTPLSVVAWSLSLGDIRSGEHGKRFSITNSKRPAIKMLTFRCLFALSYLQKEAQHVEGLPKECAVVTHHRLEVNKDGKLVLQDL